MSITSGLRRAMLTGADRGLRDVAGRVLREAQANAPVGDPQDDPDPGVSLARSGRVRRDGRGYVIEFSTPYAARQHEDTRLRHPRGGGAKFLENAMKGSTRDVERLVASEVKALMASELRSRR